MLYRNRRICDALLPKSHHSSGFGLKVKLLSGHMHQWANTKERKKKKNTVGCINTPLPACFGILVESVGVFAWFTRGCVTALDFDLGLTAAAPAPGNTPFKHSSPRLMRDTICWEPSSERVRVRSGGFPDRQQWACYESLERMASWKAKTNASPAFQTQKKPNSWFACWLLSNHTVGLKCHHEILLYNCGL